jgi:hypothetical protein
MFQRCLFCGGNASEPDHALRCDGRQGRVEARESVLPGLQGMVHHGDPHTSVESAIVILRQQNELHVKVEAAFVEHGQMTDEQLEELPEFVGYGPSTIRKRRSELYHAHRLVKVGEQRNRRGRKMLVWDLARLRR